MYRPEDAAAREGVEIPSRKQRTRRRTSPSSPRRLARAVAALRRRCGRHSGLLDIRGERAPSGCLRCPSTEISAYSGKVDTGFPVRMRHVRVGACPDSNGMGHALATAYATRSAPHHCVGNRSRALDRGGRQRIDAAHGLGELIGADRIEIEPALEHGVDELGPSWRRCVAGSPRCPAAPRPCRG